MLQPCRSLTHTLTHTHTQIRRHTQPVADTHTHTHTRHTHIDTHWCHQPTANLQQPHGIRQTSRPTDRQLHIGSTHASYVITARANNPPPWPPWVGQTCPEDIVSNHWQSIALQYFTVCLSVCCFCLLCCQPVPIRRLSCTRTALLPQRGPCAPLSC